ncbi:T9SS type A sorting domain-containing protein [Hymenobacter gummosus]|uniref:T9SS type A sorting domain-containing protein n=1 Tax=Hymenobacter gummosus TaxID=1776032 RepID=A0A431U1Q6_9BACT|nr:T9SS type A sorting domain-containing protein [Hymenobacter gummosus]RTQ49142.1 T9SS type A sorting domain-containing protein [Hymenobacter gummosus]
MRNPSRQHAGWGGWLRRPVVLLMLLVSSILGSALPGAAQTISQAEYYLDSPDPGFGAATPITISTPAADLAGLSFTHDVSGLSAGFHRLSVRTKDAGGQWSLTTRRTFYYEPLAATAANVNKVEYFVDTDPGFGLATDVPVTAGTDLAGVTFSLNVSTLSTGFHVVGVRSRDANGQWSLTTRRTFYYEPAAATAVNINKAEYFVDTDPGFGAATDIPVTSPATDVSGLAFSYDVSSLATGFHSLGVRTRDANGNWSLTTRRTFYYEPAAATAVNVTKVEYFLDADPGFGQGTDVPITAGLDVAGVAVSIPVGALSTGFHTISVRSRDASGRWSLTTARPFYYEPVPAAAPNITKIEYYFDTDPGFGSGTDVPVAAPAPDLAGFGFVADASGLTDGAHRFFVRTRDANGKWSLVTNRSFLKNGCASSTNFAAGLPASSYNYGGSTNGLVETAFNADPASPNTSNSFYGYNGSLLQADMGAAQTISEVRYKLTPSNTSNFTLLLQTAPAINGTFTTVDTYSASFVANATTLVARTLAAPVSARVVRIVIQNAAGQYAIISGAGAYYFNCAGPTITSFTPAGGAPGTSVVITGTNLTGATAVTFNGTAAPGFVVNSGTQITVSAPAGGTTGQICVTTPGGTACSAASYAYPPTIATGTVSPSSFCASTFISVPFTTNTSAYLAGNQFKFQLSDANGVFSANSRLYGSSSSLNANGGVLTDSIAFRTPAGTGYRIRVVATNPPVTGTDNGVNLTVRPTPVATAAAAQTSVPYNGTIQLTAGPAGQSSYQWYVQYAAGGTGYVGSGATLSLNNAQPSQSGRYYVYVQNSGGCQDSASVRVTVQPSAQPILTIAQFSYNGCAGNSLNVGFTVQGNVFGSGNVLTAQLSDAAGSFASPTDIGSVNFSGQGSGSVLVTFPAATPTGTGYRVRLVASSPSVTSQTDNGANISLIQRPVAVASSNSPVPYGGTIQLMAQPVAGATYQWLGPNFASTQQNPIITNATQNANQGTYTLYVTVGGCQSVAATTQVTVQPSTDPILSVVQFSGTFCAGATRNVGYSVTGNNFAAGNVLTAQLSDASGSFAAPMSIGSVSFSGQGSGSIPVTFPLGTAPGAGYRVRIVGSSPAVQSINDNGSNLTINATPTAAVLTSNSPVATGGTVTLTAQAVSGATYAWSVPGFGNVSTGSSPTLNFNNATTSNSGTYTLTVTLGSCSASTTAQVTVQPGAPTLVLNSSAARQTCAGNVLSLGFTVDGSGLTAGGTVSAELSDENGSFAAPTVIGTRSFTGTGSSSVSVTVPASAATGSLYRVRLSSTNPALLSTESGLWSITNLTGVTASSNSPVAAGGTIQLTSAGVPAGATIQWSGPNFSSSQPNPQIQNASQANAGSYTLNVTQGGCTIGRTITVSIGQPVASVTTGQFSGAYCPGSALSVPFSTQGVFGAGNVFTALLSDANGSFASPTSIGTLSLSGSGISGSIAATIPAGAAVGSGYRIRVDASAPATSSSNDNGTNLAVQSVSFTWTGGFSTNWFDARNWSCGQVPTATSNVIISTGTYYPIVTGTGAAVSNITVVSGATFQVSSTLTIYGNVVSNGIWLTGGSYVFAGSGTQTVGGSSAVYFGGVTINAGAVMSLATNIYVSGGWVNNGTTSNGFIGGSYFVDFNGTVAQLIGGSAVTNFYSVVISNTAGGLTLNQNIYVLGNWTNNGATSNSFVGGSYVTTFAGTINQIIGGTQVTNFGGLTILNTAGGVTLSTGIGLGGAFVNNGQFVVGVQSVAFNGTVVQTIGGSAQTTFYHVTINNTVGVTLVSNIYVRGDWLNNGQFTAGSYTVVFNGTVAQLIGGSQVTNFYDVTFQNPVSVTLHQDIYVLGGFVNTGVFYGYYLTGGVPTGHFVRFGGSTAQVVTTNATTYFWHFYVGNAAGVSLASNIYVAGNYYLYSGSFAAGSYTVYFNGLGGYVQTVGGYTSLSFYGWNIVSGTEVRLLQNVTWLGSFVNNGVFYGYNLVGGVYTGYTSVFGGSAAQVISGTGVYNFWHVTWNNLVSVTLQQNVYVLGNWLNNGGFVHGGYTVYFDGPAAQLIGGSVNTTFYHVSVGNLVSVTLAQPITVLGNWSGLGVFLGGSYLVYFNGSAAQTITASADTRFYNIRFQNPASVTLLSDLYLTGNWVNDGGFVAGGYGVYFSGTALQTIGGTALSQFHHLTISPLANVRIDRAVTVLGDWTTNGTFLANGYVVTFAGTVNQIIGGSIVVPFYGIVINNTVSVTLAQDIRVRGGWVNNGVFVPATYTVYFDGTVAQLIGGTAVTTFHHINILNTVGVTLGGPIFVTGNWLNNGLFTVAGYLVTFNGTVAQTIGGTAVTVFNGLTFNNAVGVSLLNDIRVRGDLRNLALFAAGAHTVYFDGSVAQGIYCPSGTLTFHDVTFANALGVTLHDNIFVTGNWLNNGGFLANGKRVTFKGSGLQTIGGSVATTFHHLTLAAGANVRIDRAITLLGNWLNEGATFVANGFAVLFNGTVAQTIGGTALTVFHHLTLGNLVGVSLDYDVDLTGNFVNTGIFCGCGKKTRFVGTVAQTITCTSGNTRFHDVTFDNAAGVTLLDAIGVTGNWVNNGGFLAGGQLVLFSGTALQTIGGTALTSFWNVQITNAVNVQLLRDIVVGGYWLNSGIFSGNGYLVTFNGSAQQTITTTGTSAKTTFHHVTWANPVGCVLGGDIYVTGNWLCNGPFNPATYTVYFTGTLAQTIGGTSQIRFYGLNVQNTVGLSCNGPVYLYGNLTNGGLVNVGTYPWYCVGTAAQTFGGTTTTPLRFYDLLIQNGSGVALTSAYGVTHVLTLTSGNLASDGFLTLHSTATGTAMVVNPAGGGLVTGRSTMERFITGVATTGYRHYASPMQLGSATVNEFADDLPVFELNPAYNTQGNTVTPFPTFYQYDETRLNGSANFFDRGWMVPTSSDNLLPLRGYSAMTDPSTTVDISGVLQNGAVSIPLSRGGQSGSGWNLLGNPYPAPIDWDLVPATAGLDKALYVYVPSGRYTGAYRSYVNGIGQNGGSKDLAAMQGFFVRATAAAATVSMTNAVRHTTYLSPAFDRQASGSGNGPAAGLKPLLRLEARNAQGQADETVLYFDPQAGPGYQANFDAYKVQLNGNGRPSLWSKTATDALSINGLPSLASAGVVPLGLRVSQNGAHTLVLTALQNLPGTQVMLEDRLLGRRQDLALDSVYSFTMHPDSTRQRFFLWFQPRVTSTGPAQLQASLSLYPNPTPGVATLTVAGLKETGTVKAEVLNTVGQVVRTISLPVRQGLISQELNLRELPTGVYSLRLHTAQGTLVRRLVKE